MFDTALKICEKFQQFTARHSLVIKFRILCENFVSKQPKKGVEREILRVNEREQDATDFYLLLWKRRDWVELPRKMLSVCIVQPSYRRSF